MDLSILQTNGPLVHTSKITTVLATTQDGREYIAWNTSQQKSLLCMFIGTTRISERERVCT